MKRLLSIAVALLLATSANAENSPTEKAEIKEIHVAKRDYLYPAAQYLTTLLAQTVAAQAATAGSANLLEDMVTRMQQAMDRCDHAVILLLGIKVDVTITTPPTYTTTGKTAAFTLIDPANLTCGGCSAGALKTNFDTLANDTNQSAGFRATAQLGENAMDGFNTAMGNVSAAAGNFDNAMPSWPATSAASIRDFGSYSNLDTGAEFSVSGRGASVNHVGPHGSYVGGIRTMFIARNNFTTGVTFLQRAMDYSLNGEAAYTQPQYVGWAAIFSNIWAMLEMQMHWIMGIADIPISDAECGRSAFRLGADVLEGLLSHETGMPFHFKALSDDAFTVLNEALTTRPVGRSYMFGADEFAKGWLFVSLEAWRYNDGAGMTSLDFPIPRVFNLHNLRDQFAHSNSTHVPPLCPDSTIPVVTAIVSPTASDTIGGMVTLQASVTDNIAVNEVKFFVGAQQLGLASTVAPWSVRWDSKEIANGARTIIARAYDAAGNVSTDVTVAVTVSN